MKRVWLSLVTVLAAAPAFSQTVQLTIPVPPPAYTVPVDQAVTLNGIGYRVTGTLTLTPVAAPVGGSVKPAATGYLDLNGQPLTNALAPGDSFMVQGQGFGSSGKAMVGGFPAEVVSWLDTLVVVKAAGPPPFTVGLFPAGMTDYYIGLALGG